MNNLQNTSIPIIFIHKGYNIFLEYTLRQCRYSNPNAFILLLGDRHNRKFSFVEHRLLDEYSQAGKIFENIYKHLSTNNYEYEVFCFLRWFYVHQYMLQNNMESAFICDSDLMIYKDVSCYNPWNMQTNALAAYCISEQTDSELHWCASAHSSYWTIKGIQSFCNFLIDTYKHNITTLSIKSNYHIENNIPGGICDMTLLYLFYKENPTRIINLLKPTSIPVEVFDNNINESHNLKKGEYITDSNGFKNVTQKNNRVVSFNLNMNSEIYFNSLHFQGSAKKRIHHYYQGDDVAILSTKRLINKIKSKYESYATKI